MQVDSGRLFLQLDDLVFNLNILASEWKVLYTLSSRCDGPLGYGSSLLDEASSLDGLALTLQRKELQVYEETSGRCRRVIVLVVTSWSLHWVICYSDGPHPLALRVQDPAYCPPSVFLSVGSD